jgi:hypothetical protein
MYINRTITFITLAAIITANIYSQQCKNFHESKDCFIYIPDTKKYEQYSQAKSALTEIGIKNIYKIVLFGGKDYIVGVCAELGYRPIHFRITDSQTKKVIYDNKDYDYIESFGFTVEKTQPIDIEITVLENKNIPLKKTKMCVGIEIVYSNNIKSTNK